MTTEEYRHQMKLKKQRERYHADPYKGTVRMQRYREKHRAEYNAYHREYYRKRKDGEKNSERNNPGSS